MPWNTDADEISDQLKKSNVPHFKISGADSFKQVHMRTLMAHLNAVYNDFDLMAWSRILKQTNAVDSYKEGRQVIERMRSFGMCPSDLLRDNGTYLQEFVSLFDSEEIVLFDTETTGVDVFSDDIVQIAAFIIRGGEIVPGSFFDIIIELSPDKTIPPKLGKETNPLIEKYNNAEVKYSHREGLSMFLEYIGNRTLMGHNVDYDYNILKYNLEKYCGIRYDAVDLKVFDTLKLVHLVGPKQVKYKLGYLVEQLGLSVSDQQNIVFHQADEDIKATYELAKYCRKEAEKHLTEQSFFLQNKITKQIINEWSEHGYKECYLHSKNNLFVLLPDDSEYAFTKEMKKATEKLKDICEFIPVDIFDSILDFLNADVISKPKPEPNALYSHFTNHLMDLSTFREADLCASSSFKEKLFVSTVHKAKGLEFENVLVMRAITGRYPHFSNQTIDKESEDKRLFYVGISRAMKRLIVSGVSCFITPFIIPIIHNFTFRFELVKIDGVRVIVEIGSKKLRVKTVVETVDYNIENVYNNSIRNQLELKKIIADCYSNDSISNTFNIIENKLRILGGYPEIQK